MSTSASQDDVETQRLVAEAARREPRALRTLAQRLLPVIRARVRRLRARRAAVGTLDEQDLIQEVWVTLLEDDARQLRQWDPARGATLEGYVGMVTHREFGNATQKASAKKRGGHLVALDEIAEPAKSGPSPEAYAIGRDEARRLGDYLAAELPTKGQVVFRCLYTDEMSPDEAAEALGVNRQVVYNWQHKIRQLARAFISPAGA